MKHAPDSGGIGCGEALAQLVSDTLGAVGGVGLAMGKHGLTIRISYHPASVLVRGGGAVSRLGSFNPAPDGAAVNLKATCEFALGDTALVEPLNFSPLCHGQGGLGVILHVSPAFVSVAPPLGVLT